MTRDDPAASQPQPEAPYAGWPRAMSAMAVAREVFRNG
jgi:hypothetical protein